MPFTCFPRQRSLVGQKQTTALRPGNRVSALREQACASDPYDLVLDLQGNLKSGVVARLAGARTRFGLPVGDSREGNAVFVRKHAGRTPHRHRVERNLVLASHAVGMPVPYVPPGFPRSEATREAADAMLAPLGLGDDFVVLHPGTSGFGSFKRWPLDRFAALARRLLADGRSVLITGSRAESELGRTIRAATDFQARFLATPSLDVLAEVIARASLFVAADTGPLHLAALVETPLLGLYGPKDTSIYGPYGRDTNGHVGPLRVLTQDEVACRPCTLRKCDAPLCMTTLDVDRVHETVKALVSDVS